MNDAANSLFTVSELYYYPIKSCRGIRLTSASIGPRSFLLDRAFMLVDPSGHLLTQRELPRMALIEVLPDAQGTCLTLQAPDRPMFQLERHNNGAMLDVVIWRNQCRAVDQGDAVADWLSAFLGKPCRLVYLPADSIRPVNPKYARSETDQVGFADGYPFLLISQASLDDLNQRLPADMHFEMRRFRPNIVVSGCEPYAEDTWKRIRINGHEFSLVKPSERCIIITIDPDSAIQGKEPLKTLATYRRSTDGPVLFGQNLIHHQHQGTINEGSIVEIIEYQ